MAMIHTLFGCDKPHSGAMQKSWTTGVEVWQGPNEIPLCFISCHDTGSKSLNHLRSVVAAEEGKCPGTRRVGDRPRQTGDNVTAGCDTLMDVTRGCDIFYGFLKLGPINIPISVCPPLP